MTTNLPRLRNRTLKGCDMGSNPLGTANKSTAYDTPAAKSAEGKFGGPPRPSRLPRGAGPLLRPPDDGGSSDEHRHFIGRYGDR